MAKAKSRAVWIGLGAIVITALGTGSLAIIRPALFGLSRHPHWTSRAQCKSVGMPHGNMYQGSEIHCTDLFDEADILKANPGLGARSGDRLTLMYGDRSVATLTDGPDANGDCDTFNLYGVMTVFDRTAGALRKVPLVGCHHGEFENHFALLPDGKRWLIGNADASPDGHLVAASGASYRDDAMTVYSWPELTPLARFALPCWNIAWKDNSTLTVTCDYRPANPTSGHPDGFDGRIWRDADEKWHLQATRWTYSDADDNDDYESGAADSAEAQSAQEASAEPETPLPRFDAQ